MKLEYINIIDAIQYAVDKIVKEKYKYNTPPKFIVSQMDRYNSEGKVGGHEIVLTIEHMGWKRTRTLFPNLSCGYGYEPLEREIEYLYNSTM